MELQLGLALPSYPSKPTSPSPRKRTFDHAAEAVIPPTLSLLPLTPSPLGLHHEVSSDITKNGEEGVAESLVGWPPLNPWRKKLRFHDDGDHDGNTIWIHHCRHGHVGLRGSKTSYVKVKMEGVGIARKVDLSMHQSFHTLMETLMDMFGNGQQLSSSYKLAYQDTEGDWLLAEDVPWRNFVQCAQRLKLLKSIG